MTIEPAPADGDWLPVGEEPQPVGSITHLLVLRSDETSLLSRPDGDIDAATEPATGMYHKDTRYLSKLSFTFGGVPPTVLDARETEHGLSAIFTNPALKGPEGQTIPAQALTVRRRRVLIEGLLESFTISNYSQRTVGPELRIAFDADFADIFEVRGFERTQPRSPVKVEVESNAVHFSYTGSDAVTRTTSVRFHTTPERLTRDEAVFRVELEPRQTQTIEVEVCTERGLCERNFSAAATRVKRRQREWFNGLTRIETDDGAVNQVIERALLDIEALRDHVDGHEFIAAGVPWFDTLFGRDSLITGMELLAFCPQVLRASLKLLAKYQSDGYDRAKDAEPGKIPHELRWGELANTGEVPFGRYYGSVDVTPLYILAAFEYLRWTGDLELIRELWPHIERAMDWCVTTAAKGPRGFLAYERKTAIGLENQGWKDSHDAIVWPTGELVKPPIALVEVQGYLGAAFGAYVSLALALGLRPRDDEIARPGKFAQALEAAFGHEELGYVLCLDGDGQPVPTPASNAGHVLWTGMASRTSSQRVSDMLFGGDMFSGWGIRTLSSSVVGFNPIGYHVGSVWPHDNAIILNGLRWYGFDDHARELGNAMIETALAFPEYRMPELFSGDAREFRLVPTPYPVASRPQAWAAASIPSVFSSLLGLRPGQANQLHIVRPTLPLGLREVHVRHLRLGNGSVDLTFRRLGSHVSVEVEQIAGRLEVALASGFPDELA
ncbi:MAG: glycogen debranching N-terminal domain-containing protein [Hyphomicrobiales bacterium]